MRRTRPFSMLKHLAFLLLLAAAPGVLRAQAPSQDPVAKARALAYSGREHRAQALAILQEYLKQDPTDSDARTLYGIVL
ncbi:MAG TPA: hypothetical protein VEG08_10155, partial [Terriglobales bacterium]|nr:hypothetical protein [Terriglobales bacterium]